MNGPFTQRRVLVLLISCTPLWLFAGITCADAPAGLLAEWNFDEGQGDIVRDTSGNGHDATFHGARWVGQGGGFALRLDGRGDYVDGGPSAKIGVGGPVTLETWIKPTMKATAEAIVLGEGVSRLTR